MAQQVRADSRQPSELAGVKQFLVHTPSPKQKKYPPWNAFQGQALCWTGEGTKMGKQTYRGCREERIKSRRTVTLGPYAPMRPASTGSPRLSAWSRSTPASSSSDKLKPCAGCTRFRPVG